MFTLYTVELFDQDPQAKEKGSLNVNFRDQNPHFSTKSAHPCQGYQN